MRPLPILLILPIVLLLTTASGQDLCDDPRTSDFNRSCATQSFAVQIPSVGGNPNHALHDTLWGVSHYLRNCVRHPLTVYVSTVQELALCAEPDVGPQPDWGFCVAYILTKAVGAAIDTGDRGIENIGKGLCHTTETVLRQKIEGWPETFRGLNWLVDYSDGFGYRPLERIDAAKAFRHIRSVVRRFYGLHAEREWDGINVLIYDRSDARRRRWGNARGVVEMVRRIPDARVNYIQRMPHGLGKQVELFGKSDLVIAPHGAAMVNSVFMNAGGGIVEISKECLPDWAKRRGSEWTGWHARFVGLKLVYVSCQSDHNSTHRVDVEEVEKAVLRLMPRIRESRLRQGVSVERTRSFADKALFVSVVGVAVLSLLRLQKLYGASFLRRRKAKPDRR